MKFFDTNSVVIVTLPTMPLVYEVLLQLLTIKISCCTLKWHYLKGFFCCDIHILSIIWLIFFFCFFFWWIYLFFCVTFIYRFWKGDIFNIILIIWQLLFNALIQSVYKVYLFFLEDCQTPFISAVFNILYVAEFPWLEWKSWIAFWTMFVYLHSMNMRVIML